MVTQALQDRFHALGGTTRFLRDTMLFLGGVEALHTLSHVWMAFAGMLPMTVPVFPAVSVTLTEGVNLFAIFANGFIAAGLLYGAHRLKK
jgi:hypothetical protein